MNLELAGGPLPKPAESRPRRRKRVAPAAQNKASSLDICVISSNAFRHGLHRARYNSKATHGLTDEYSFSIFQLDQALQQRLDSEDEVTREEILQTLPSELSSYADVFSKKASNELLLHRDYDYRIDLKLDSPPL